MSHPRPERPSLAADSSEFPASQTPSLCPPPPGETGGAEVHPLRRPARAARTAGRAVKTPRFPNWAVQGVAKPGKARG